MKIEVWSDVICPWCYIGKRRFAKALEEFPNKSEVSVEWKSFQLYPSAKTDLRLSTSEFLSRSKGLSPSTVSDMINNVTKIAKEEGLVYHIEKSIVVNTFDAHRLIQMAQKQNLGDKAAEAIFKAYFTDSLNIADFSVLASLGESVGMNDYETLKMLESDAFSEKVRSDMLEARQLGINGVPCFVFDRKFALSGAQLPATFSQALEKAYKN